MKTFSGERPHCCKVCHKGFIKSSGLTQHMRRHFRTSQKPSVSGSVQTEENDQVELINIQQNTENVMICYKEFNENSESFDEYLENCQ